MPSKLEHLYNDTLVLNGNMASDITTDSFNVIQARSFSVQADWSGNVSLSGVFKVQASNNNSTFVDLVTQTISSTAGSLLVNVELPAYGWARCKWESLAGSGALTIVNNAKA